jgi:coenzyme F420-reducing hydrogenase gamma subunit
MITEETLNSFVYETLNEGWSVTDPADFDQNIPGCPFETKELAEQAFRHYVTVNEITFE